MPEDTGADVHVVPALPYKDPSNNYVKLSGRLAQEMENAIQAFDNGESTCPLRTTGAEIWEKARLIRVTSRTGRLAGVFMYLKEKKSAIKRFWQTHGQCTL